MHRAIRHQFDSSMRCGSVLAIIGGCASLACGQWTVSYQVDDAQATAVLGADRVLPMHKALDRAKSKLELIFSGSTGGALITVDWTAPTSNSAAASSTPSHVHTATLSVARNKLINQATADDEPASEIQMYEALPTTSVPFHYSETDSPTSSSVLITNCLNKHLAFQQTADQNDGTIKFRPEDATTKWQFWKKSGAQLAGHEVFEAVAFHETLHLLGFVSRADNSTEPVSLSSWDLFRFNDASIPVSAASFTTLARELRPTEEATGITALGSSTHAYKLTRGARTGGDGFGASHWRALNRLDPADAIGVMDPTPSGAVHANLGERVFTRPDVEAMDVMGWNINPDNIQFANAATIELTAPAVAAQITEGTEITFAWGETSFLDFDVYVYPGAAIVDDNPIRVFSDLPGNTTSVALAVADTLPPGEYVWTVVGSTQTGYQSSEDRVFTIVSACDSLDFNQDSLFPDTQDIADFLSVFAGGLCDGQVSPPPCNDDIDFNNDSLFPDTADIASLLSVFSGGPCF